VAHRVVLAPDVDAEVQLFSKSTLRYWTVAIASIAQNPQVRTGVCELRIVSMLPWPRRVRAFHITRELSISGEEMRLFLTDFLPVSIVYVVKAYGDAVRAASGYAGEARVISLRRYQRRP
jgi:hypothetical protein